MIEPIELLREFMLIPAPSGYEELMARAMRKALTPFAEDIQCDRAGNIVARIPGTNRGAYRSMVFAHMDQIGFIVTNVAENGLLRLTRNGSVPDKVAPGLGILVRTGRETYIPAVIAAKSHHVMSAADKVRVDPITSLYADIGVKSRARAHELGVRIGCPAVYAPSFRRMDGATVSGTSIDNRGGCLALALVAEKLAACRPPPGDVFIVGTTQEEHNLRGAIVATRAVQPDVAICFDIAMSSDEPGLGDIMDTPMGGGPVISMYTYHGRGTLNGVIAHEGLVELAQRIADENGTPLNRFAVRGTLSDATYVQLEGTGPATIDLSFPIKYSHSPCELVDVSDVVGLADLTGDMLLTLDGDFPIKRYEA